MQKQKTILIAISHVLTLVLVSVVGMTTVEAAEKFRASAVKMDITPDQPQWLAAYATRKSQGVHDKIYHRIAAMDDGKTQLFLVSSDLTVISGSYYHELCRGLEKETGVQEKQVWWTVTHTHSVPAVGSFSLSELMRPWRKPHEPNTEYSNWVKRQLIEGIKTAQSRLEPARLAVTTGFSMANINRRAKNSDGTVSLGLNPEGPVDRRIGLIRLERLDGSLLALIANYAMHGTVLGGRNSLISGDAAGIVAEYVQSRTGAPMLFINGAAGNIAPIYSDYPKGGHLTQFKVLLGDRILSANRSISKSTSKITLWTGEKVIETPQKKDFGWVEDLPESLRVTDAGERMMRIPVRFLKINHDIVIWSAPVELFNEIATDVRNHSPYPYTFFFGYTNGYLGYFPTRQAFAEGGYEPGLVCPFTEQAEDDIKAGVLAYLESMSQQHR